VTSHHAGGNDLVGGGHLINRHLLEFGLWVRLQPTCRVQGILSQEKHGSELSRREFRRGLGSQRAKLKGGRVIKRKIPLTIHRRPWWTGARTGQRKTGCGFEISENLGDVAPKIAPSLTNAQLGVYSLKCVA
jgi:hypothetical protein